MPTSVRIGKSGDYINLNDGVAWKVVWPGSELGDRGLLFQTWAEGNLVDGAPLASQRFGNRRIPIQLLATPTTMSSIYANLRALNRMLVGPAYGAALEYVADGGSTVNYLDLLPSPPAYLSYDGQSYYANIEINTRPHWRTIALSSPRYLENWVKNAFFSRWTGANPDDWSQEGTPTTFAKSTTNPIYGLNTLRIVADAASEGCYQDLGANFAENTVYAVYAKVNIVSGTVALRCTGSAGGNPSTLDTDNTVSPSVTLSGLYTTAAGQTNIILYVESSGGMAEFRVQAVYCALASNSAAAVPTEFISYTGDLYNQEDVTADHVNGVYLADLLGEVPALSEARFTSTTLAAAADRIHLALQDTHPQYHVFQYQAEVGTQNGAWPAALANGGADASPEGVASNIVQLTAPAAPGTKTWAWACRVTLSPLSGEAATVWRYRQGRFRALALVATDATTASNWELKAALVVGGSTTQFNPAAALALNGSVYHLVDLGEFTIPAGTPRSDATLNPLRMEIQGQVTTEPNKVLNIDCVFLLPTEALIQTVQASNAAAWSVNGRVYTGTLESYTQRASIDDGANYYADAFTKGAPLYLPVQSGKTEQGAYDTHFILNWLIQRDAGGCILTDRCALRLAYVPQYLWPSL